MKNYSKNPINNSKKITRKTATAIQKKSYEDFCKAVRTIESTVPSAIFVTNSINHKNFTPMFLEDDTSVVLKAKYVFREIGFPEPVSKTKIVFDTEWENPKDVDWKKECKTYMKFYMQALENNMFFINKWLDEAYYTMKNIDSNYDFNISKDSMYDVVFEDMYLD